MHAYTIQIGTHSDYIHMRKLNYKLLAFSLLATFYVIIPAICDDEKGG